MANRPLIHADEPVLFSDTMVLPTCIMPGLCLVRK